MTDSSGKLEVRRPCHGRPVGSLSTRILRSQIQTNIGTLCPTKRYDVKHEFFVKRLVVLNVLCVLLARGCP